MAIPKPTQATAPPAIRRIHVSAHQGYILTGCPMCKTLMDAKPGTLAAAMLAKLNGSRS